MHSFDCASCYFAWLNRQSHLACGLRLQGPFKIEAQWWFVWAVSVVVVGMVAMEVVHCPSSCFFGHRRRFSRLGRESASIVHAACFTSHRSCGFLYSVTRMPLRMRIRHIPTRCRAVEAAIGWDRLRSVGARAKSARNVGLYSTFVNVPSVQGLNLRAMLVYTSAVRLKERVTSVRHPPCHPISACPQ